MWVGSGEEVEGGGLFLFVECMFLCKELFVMMLNEIYFRRLGNMRTAARSPDAWHRMFSPPNSVDAPQVPA